MVKITRLLRNYIAVYTGSGRNAYVCIFAYGDTRAEATQNVLSKIEKAVENLRLDITEIKNDRI